MMMSEKVTARAAKLEIERAAVSQEALMREYPPENPTKEEAIGSIAVSLKRIADAVAPTNGTDIASALHYLTVAIEQK